MSDAEQAQFTALLAAATQGPAARVSDWTPAFDDGLVQRLEACTLCGRRDLALWGIVSLWAQAMAYVLCGRCLRADGVRQVARLCLRRCLATQGQG